MTYTHLAVCTSISAHAANCFEQRDALSISAAMAGLADLFIDVTKEFNCSASPSAHPQVIPENGFGLIQLIFL